MLARRHQIARIALGALTAATSLFVGHNAVLAAEGDEVEYTFGRPVTDGEHTYDWYRKTHADWAAKRYGVDPKKVRDGMDTWHWWCGVDNPQFWRKMAILSAKNNVANVNAAFLYLLNNTPRTERWDRIGLINDPDCVPAEKPDKYGLMIDQMKDGALTWNPEVFGYSSGVIGLQLFANKKFDASKWSVKKYMNNPATVEPPYLVGMSCVLCHTSFNPDKPPQDPANPKWDNLS